MGRDWVYVSGPVTGMPHGNRPAFEDAAARLAAAGFRPVVPTRFVADAPWPEAMRRCVAALTACHGVATLPGSSLSKGASLEVRVAGELGMPVATVDEWVVGAREIGGSE